VARLRLRLPRLRRPRSRNDRPRAPWDEPGRTSWYGAGGRKPRTRPPWEPRYQRRALVAGLIVVLFAGGVTALLLRDGGSSEKVQEASGGGPPRERTSFLARLIPPPAEEKPKGPRVPRSITDLSRRLPLERKVAQLFLVGFRGQDLNSAVFRRLRRLDLGGIVIDRQNYTDPEQLASLAGEAGVIAREVKHVPPWVMASQEGGEFSQFPDLPPRFPAADLRDTREAAKVASQTGATLRKLGITGLLGPVIDVGNEDGSGIGIRAFSDDPQQVARYARVTVPAYREAGMLSAVEHFPGVGAATTSTEEGPVSIGLALDELLRRDVVPFRAAVRAGAPAVVIGHASYAPDDFVVPASLSSKMSTDLLRDQLGFRGVAITDDLADPAITAVSPVPQAAVRAFRAGADMLYVSGSAGDQQAAYVAVLDAVRRKRISRKRLDKALLRVLSAKRAYGLIRR
jgi:beta-N-acetylhexosaminidase